MSMERPDAGAPIATHRDLPVDYHEGAAGQTDQLLV